jgi:hypothetical protein
MLESVVLAGTGIGVAEARKLVTRGCPTETASRILLSEPSREDPGGQGRLETLPPPGHRLDTVPLKTMRFASLAAAGSRMQSGAIPRAPVSSSSTHAPLEAPVSRRDGHGLFGHASSDPTVLAPGGRPSVSLRTGPTMCSNSLVPSASISSA